MRKTFLMQLITAAFLLFTSAVLASGGGRIQVSDEYILVVEGFDWGPAVSKVILEMDNPQTTVDFKDYAVVAERNSSCAEIPAAARSGNRTVVFAYVSDQKGNRLSGGTYVTLVLYVAPNLLIASPFHYSSTGTCRGNNWVNYKLRVTDTKNNRAWIKEKSRVIPLVDEFDLSGKFKYEDGKSMSYAFFKPKTTKEKSPLIIWLHGGGEGGTDPTIPLLGNKAANYASGEIQDYFGGAYVLVPQCPGAWMHNKDGVITHGQEDDVYNNGLMALIKDFVNSQPDIDKKRIYVGGCSNGGYMALKLILNDPAYFAAGYISALAYQSQYLSDNQIKSIRQVPIWFVHAKDDSTTIASKTVIPVYQRLKAAGAPNLHFSFYDHVTDLSGFFGGENFLYNGHWSWIYSHVNHAKRGYDGKPVIVKGKAVTIMEWMAAQSK